MKYELVKLEAIFSRYFNDRKKDEEEQEQRNAVEELLGECERIEAVFLEILFSCIPDENRKRFIGHHQQRLQLMEDKLYRYMELNKQWLMNVDALAGYERISKAFAQLLRVIEVHFAADMLTDNIAPVVYNLDVTKEITEGMIALQDKLVLMSVEHGLADIVLEGFELFAERKGSQLSAYGQVNMMRSLLNMIVDYEPPEPVAITANKGADKWLIELLCQHNFNRLSFYKYCRNWIVKYFLREDMDKLYLYTRCGKFFSGLPVHASWGWHLQRMRITDMLTDYFRDNFLAEERKMQLELRGQYGGNGTHLPNGKLHMNLTVDQLGLLIRLMNDSDMIKSGSIASVVRFFVHHVSTVGKDPMKELSYDYLKITYNKTSLGIIEKVEQHLQQMTKLLHQIRIETRQAVKKEGKGGG